MHKAAAYLLVAGELVFCVCEYLTVYVDYVIVDAYAEYAVLYREKVASCYIVDAHPIEACNVVFPRRCCVGCECEPFVGKCEQHCAGLDMCAWLRSALIKALSLCDVYEMILVKSVALRVVCSSDSSLFSFSEAGNCLCPIVVTVIPHALSRNSACRYSIVVLLLLSINSLMFIIVRR